MNVGLGLAKAALPIAHLERAIASADAGDAAATTRFLRDAHAAATKLDVPAWRAAIMIPAAEAGIGRLPLFEVGQLARSAAQIVRG